MGGRGAASGISKDGNQYGTQYHTLLQDGNIKFVSKTTRQSETLMETMTPGRVYVHVGGNTLLRIISFDETNKRDHVIEFDKRTNTWHAHNGYFHTEKGKSKHEPLSAEDKKMLEKVQKLWHNHKGV